jgi:hypothetical protein
LKSESPGEHEEFQMPKLVERVRRFRDEYSTEKAATLWHRLGIAESIDPMVGELQRYSKEQG